MFPCFLFSFLLFSLPLFALFFSILHSVHLVPSKLLAELWGFGVPSLSLSLLPMYLRVWCLTSLPLSSLALQDDLLSFSLINLPLSAENTCPCTRGQHWWSLGPRQEDATRSLALLTTRTFTHGLSHIPTVYHTLTCSPVTSGTLSGPWSLDKLINLKERGRETVDAPDFRPFPCNFKKSNPWKIDESLDLCVSPYLCYGWGGLFVVLEL